MNRTGGACLVQRRGSLGYEFAAVPAVDGSARLGLR